MKSGTAQSFVWDLDILYRAGPVGDLTDRELLEHFTTRADTVGRRAFEAIVGRHGPMVLGVCRRVLRDEHTAEDAFQATFLALALKAGTIRNRDSLGSWLHGVAARISRRAREMSRRRAVQPTPHASLTSSPSAESDFEAIELRSVLDEELHRLPHPYRAAVVLCYLEGKTQEDAAHELGWTKGTVSGRLARAKDLLRARLCRRGMAPWAGLVPMLLPPSQAPVGVPVPLADSTVRAAIGLALGRPEASVASRSVVALANGALRAMFVTRVKLALGGLLLSVAVATALAQTGELPGALGNGHRDQNRLAPERNRAGIVRTVAAKPLEPKLPQHARVRLGTTRLRHTSWVTSIAFAPDDRTVASAGADGAVRFWDLATGEPAAKLPAIKESAPSREVIAQSVAYSPDGSTLVIGRRSGLVQVWDVTTGKERVCFQAHRDCVWGIAFAPNGLTFATGSDQDPLVRIWDSATGLETRTFEHDAGPIFYPALVFSPDGKSLALGASARNSQSHSIFVWEYDGDPGPTIIRDAHLGRLVNLAFAPGGRIISCGWGARRVRDPQGNMPDELSIPQIRIWDAKSGHKLKDLDPGATEGISGLALSRDERTLVSAHHDRLLVWDLATETLRRTIAIGAEKTPMKRCPGIALSSDGKTVALERGDETVRLWDLSTGQPLFHHDNAHESEVRNVAIAASGFVATGDDNGVVRLWDAGKAKVVRRFELGCRVWAVRFSPDGRILAGAGHDNDGVHGIVRLWDLTDFSLRRELHLGLPGVVLEFAPDGRKLAVASDVITVFDVTTGKKEAELPGHRGEIRAVAFSRDAKTLISAGQEMNGQGPKFRFWDLATSRLTREIPIEGHRRATGAPQPHAPEALAFAVFGPNLITAATSGFGDQLLGWDLRTGRPTRSFVLKTYSGASLALSGDGRFLAAAVTPFSTEDVREPRAMADASIRIWELATKHEVLRLEPQTTECWSLAFSPDGKTLVSAGNDTTAIVWDLSTLYDGLKHSVNP
jgi:RNA polymerase sigma factor (sigma-70 family)